MIKYNIDNDLFGPINKISTYDMTSEEKKTNDRIYNLDVEFKEFSDHPVNTGIKFINGDRYTSIIRARMLMETNLIDLQGVTVSINLKEGNTGYDTYTLLCDNISLEESIVTVNLEPYIVDSAGVNTFEFVLIKGDKVLTSQIYSYEVKDSIGEGYIGEVEEETVLQSFIRQTQDLIDQLTIEVTNQDIEDIMNMIE